MMFPLRWAHQNATLIRFTSPFQKSHFWFPKPVTPEVLVQALLGVVCVLITGYFTTKLYQAASQSGLFTPLIYPLVLFACVATYILHTVQNFRFVYDLPSLAFFAIAMYFIYSGKRWIYFIGIFIVATVNRETILLLLPIFMLHHAVEEGQLHWRLLFKVRTVQLVIPLATFWVVWQIFIRRAFPHNVSELYPRLDWNIKSLLVPQAWPQLLSACGYLLLFVILMRRRIHDPYLKTWFWILPIWGCFMFFYGILIETRIFGELIPFIVPSAALIAEDLLFARTQSAKQKLELHLIDPQSGPDRGSQAAA